MRKYSKSLDLMVRATLLAKEGKVVAAAKALVQATEQDDLDMTLQQVDQAQQEVFDAQGADQDMPEQSLDQQMSRALARVKKHRAVRADAQQQFDEADPEGLDDDELDDLEQAGTGDIDNPESDEPFVIETAGDDEDDAAEQDEDDDMFQQQQEKSSLRSSVQARLARAKRNAKKLR